jgi:hypothetical protein
MVARVVLSKRTVGAQRAEASPEFRTELVVRHPEGGLHAAVLGPQLVEAAGAVGHPTGQEGQGPRRAALQPGARDAQGQGQAATLSYELARRLGLAVGPGLPEEFSEESDGGARVQRFHGEPQIGVQAGQALASRHQDPAARSGGEQRPHLLGAARVVDDQEQAQRACGCTPGRDEVRQVVHVVFSSQGVRPGGKGRQRVTLVEDRAQHPAKGPLRDDLLMGGAVRVQVDEEATVGVGVGERPCGTDHQSGLAHAGRAVDRHHGHGPG